MALTSVGTFLDVVLSDQGGNKSTLRFNTDYADLAALSTAVTAGDIDGIIADLQAVTDAVVYSYSMGERIKEDSTAIYGSGEVEEYALLVARIQDEPTKTTNLRIPCPVAGIFEGTEGDQWNTVDTADADLVNYMQNFTATGHILLSDGEQINLTGLKGKRAHRGSKNG